MNDEELIDWIYAECDKRGDDLSWRMGDFGEKVFYTIAVAANHFVVPLHNATSKGAPLARGRNGSIVLPDFHLWGNGHTAYVDVKVKKKPVMWRRTSELRHGIDKVNYDHYARAGIETKNNCGLAILEFFQEYSLEWSGTWLVQSFENLGTPIPGTHSQSHMVYWPRAAFFELCKMTPTQLVRASKGGMPQETYRQEMTGIFLTNEFKCAPKHHQMQTLLVQGGWRNHCIRCGEVSFYLDTSVRFEDESQEARSVQRTLF